MEEERIRRQPPARPPGPSPCSCAPAPGRCTCPRQPCVWAFYRASAFIPAAATRTAARTAKVASAPDATHTHTLVFLSCNQLVTPPPVFSLVHTSQCKVSKALERPATTGPPSCPPPPPSRPGQGAHRPSRWLQLTLTTVEGGPGSPGAPGWG